MSGSETISMSAVPARFRSIIVKPALALAVDLAVSLIFELISLMGVRRALRLYYLLELDLFYTNNVALANFERSQCCQRCWRL